MLLGPDIDRKNVIFRLKEPLREMLDPDFLLTDKLLCEEVLTDRERQKVEKKDSLQERNDALIDIVLRKGETARLRFNDSLRDTDQEHVLNFILCNGGN